VPAYGACSDISSCIDAYSAFNLANSFEPRKTLCRSVIVVRMVFCIIELNFYCGLSVFLYVTVFMSVCLCLFVSQLPCVYAMNWKESRNSSWVSRNCTNLFLFIILPTFVDDICELK